MAHGERADCPDCGRDVAVNKDGTLRKHDCVEQDTPPVEPEPAEQVDEQPPEQFDADAAPAEQVPARGKDPRLCAIRDCDRPNVLHRLCGAHYASRRGDGN